MGLIIGREGGVIGCRGREWGSGGEGRGGIILLKGFITNAHRPEKTKLSHLNATNFNQIR